MVAESGEGRGNAGDLHTKTENEGFMALSVKLFSVLFVTLLSF